MTKLKTQAENLISTRTARPFFEHSELGSRRAFSALPRPNSPSPQYFEVGPPVFWCPLDCHDRRDKPLLSLIEWRSSSFGSAFIHASRDRETNDLLLTSLSTPSRSFSSPFPFVGEERKSITALRLPSHSPMSSFVFEPREARRCGHGMLEISAWRN